MLTTPYQDTGPRWSPDGTRIAFTRGGEESENRDVHLIDSGGKSDRRVCHGGSPIWLPDGRLIVIERKNGFALAETDPEHVSVPVPGRAPSISPDARLIAFVRGSARSLFPRRRRRKARGALWWSKSTLFVQRWGRNRPEGLAKSSGSSEGEIVFGAPVWSPDGRSILIEEHDPLGGGSSRIQQVPVGEGEVRTVVSNVGYSDFELLAVAPDGKRIAFATDRGIEVVELSGGDRKTIVPLESVFAYGIEWSPDGESLAYVTDHPSERVDIRALCRGPRRLAPAASLASPGQRRRRLRLALAGAERLATRRGRGALRGGRA